MAEPRTGAGTAEVVRAIGRAVVGHDARHGDAVAREPAEGAVEEGDGAGLALVGQDLAVGEPCGIVDGDMQDLPAGTASGVAPVAGDAVADAVDAAELLGVDVEQRAGAGALIADHGRPGLEGGEAAETEAAQHQADGRAGPPQPPRDLRAGQALPAQPLDLGGDLEGQPAGRCRASHLCAVRTDTPAARAASSTRQSCSRTRATRRSRPCTVMRALLWTFIRGSWASCSGLATTALAPVLG
jgi:hypothetical protein